MKKIKVVDIIYYFFILVKTAGLMPFFLDVYFDSSSFENLSRLVTYCGVFLIDNFRGLVICVLNGFSEYCRICSMFHI